MKKAIIAIMTVLLTAVAVNAQTIKIPNTNVSFQFPTGGWKYLQTTKVNENATVYLYSWSSTYVVDSTGDTVIPFMRIYVRKNYSGTVFDMAYERFGTQPFQSLDEYPFRDGLGYWGAYANEEDGKDYLFRMVYLKDRSNMLEIRLETTRDNYDEFDDKFQEILKTVTISKSSK